MSKAAILVGHRIEAQGAYSPYLDETEFEFNSGIAEKLKQVSDVDVYFRPDTPGVSEVTRIKKVVSEINKKNYDIVISLHFNSASSEQANGCEALYYHKNQKGKKLAEFFIDSMNTELLIKKRRPIAISNKNQRGHAVVAGCNAMTLLLEPFFGSNEEDCEKMSNCIDTYVGIIQNIIKMA